MLRFIVDYVESNRRSPTIRSPTIREIGLAMGIRSTNGVVSHLDALTSKGYLTAMRQGHRSWWPVGLVMRLECDDTPEGRRLALMLGKARDRAPSREADA